MSAFPYRIVVEWSAVDEVFVARVPALPGCAAHGESEGDAAHEARLAAQAIVATAKKHKRPIPPPDLGGDYSGQLRLRLPRSLHERLARRAAVDEVSLNALLVSMLSEQIARP
jgi:predicted RNase H-like HicB family nuclease